MIVHPRPLLQGFIKALSWSSLVTGGILLIPISVWLGLLILGTDPNPRHPPIDLKGEAVGWSLFAAFLGLSSTIIAESITMREQTGFWGQYRGLVIGGLVSVGLGMLVAVPMAILTMDSVDGQGITSTRLAILSGLAVGLVGAVGGATFGAGCKRIVNHFMS